MVATVAAGATTSDPYQYRYEAMPQPTGLAPAVPLHSIDLVRRATVDCQRRAGVPLSRAELGLAELKPAGHRFRAWVLELWTERLAGCRDVLARTLPAPGDWLTAVRVVQRAYPGSEWWIRSCSAPGSEGGWGRWVPNTQGSGAGGWMQYMEGTFWHDFNAAAADLRSRGFRIPPGAASWYSPIGQAIAAGWAYNYDRPAGKWTGYGC